MIFEKTLTARCYAEEVGGKRFRLGTPPAKEITDLSIAIFRISLINDLGTSVILSEKIFSIPLLFQMPGLLIN
jgi:hypothetical protein